MQYIACYVAGELKKVFFWCSMAYIALVMPLMHPQKVIQIQYKQPQVRKLMEEAGQGPVFWTSEGRTEGYLTALQLKKNHPVLLTRD